MKQRILNISKKVIFILLLVGANSVFGQDEDMYSLTATSENMVVCGPSVKFTVVVRNNTEQSLKDIVLYPGLPTGVEYVPGSATNMTELSSETENASFQIGNIASLDSVKVTFETKADCRLIEYIQSGSATTSALANNNTRFEYTLDGTKKTYSEPNGSSSYNVSYADIELFVNEEDADIIPDKLNEVIGRRITIKNSGIGHTESLKLNINYHQDISVKGLYLTDSEFNLIEKLEPASNSNNQFVFELDNFHNSGDKDNLLEENEVLYLVDSASIGKQIASAATDYSVRWGCEDLVCNPTDQEAEYSAYLRMPIGEPSLSQIVNVVQKAELDSVTPAIIDITVTNKGKGNLPVSEAALNLYYVEFSNSRMSNFQLFIQHQQTGELINLNEFIDKTYSGYSTGSNFVRFSNFTYDIDGEGGLSDMDNDGIYDDLAVGDTINFRQLNTYYFSDKIFKGRYVTLTSCGLRYQGVSLINNYTASFLAGQIYPSPVAYGVSGPKFLEDGVTADYGFHARVNTNRSYSKMINLPRRRADLKFIVPNGLVVNSVLNTHTNEYPKYSRVGDTVYIRNLKISSSTLHNEYHGGYYRINTTLMCDSTSSLDTNLPFSYYMYYTVDSVMNESPRRIYSNESFSIQNSCLPCNSFKTTSMNVERTTFGWLPTNGITYEDLMINKTLPKANRNTPGVELQKVRVYDTFKVSINSELVETAESFRNIYADLFLESVQGSFLFDYLYGYLVVEEDTFRFKNPQQITKFKEDNLNHYNVPIPLGTEGIPQSIEPGTKFEVVLFFQYKNENTKYYYFTPQNLGATINGVSEKGISEGCSKAFFYNFKFITNPAQAGANQFNLKCRNNSGILFYAVDESNNQRYFENEFRPVNYFRNFNVDLPDGFEFDTSYTIRNNQNNGNGGTPLDSVVISNDNRTLRVYNSYITLRNYVAARIKMSEGFTPASDYTRFRVDYDVTRFFDLPPDYQVNVPNFKNTLLLHYSPSTTLTYNDIQEGYSNTVTWPISFCDLTSKRASTRIPRVSNAWVAVELKEDDNSTVLLGAKSKEGDYLPVIPYGAKDEIRPNGRHMLIQLGTIGRESCKEFDLVATYRNCINDKMQDIDLYSSWHCYTYPTLSDTVTSIMNVADKRNEILTGQISLRYKTSNIQWNIKKKAALQTELCESVPFELDITSTKYADMFDVVLWCETPKGLTIDAQPTYAYPTGAGDRTIPVEADTVSGNKKGWKLTSLTGGVLPGTRTDKNAMRVNLSVTPSCGFNPGEPVKFRLTAKTNCGDEIILDDQRKINILGIELDTLTVNVKGGWFDNCNTTSKLTVTVKNNSTLSSVSDMFEVILPKMVRIKGNVPGYNGITKMIDGQEHYYWNIPEGYLEPGESFTVDLPVELTCMGINFNELKYKAQTLVNNNTNCISGGSCNVGTTTGEHTIRALYTPVLDVIPVCSENIETERRWLIKNIIGETVQFSYQREDNPVYGTLTLNSGDSVYVVVPAIPELIVNFNYGGNFGSTRTPSIYKRCGNNILCKDFDFDLEPNNINCPDEELGGIHVQMPELEIDWYRWYKTDDFLWKYYGQAMDLENVPAGRYSLRVRILDKNGDYCYKTKSARIAEPEVHVKLNTELYNVTDCEGAYGVVKLDGVLFEDEELSTYNCFDTTTVDFNTDTAGAVLIGYRDTVVVSGGQVVKVSEKFGFRGDITIAGGTLIVQRYFRPENFNFVSGNIVIAPEAYTEIENLSVPIEGKLENYGVLETQVIDVQGQFSNYYKFSVDSVIVSGEFNNYNDGLIIDLVENNNTFFNQGDLEIYGPIVNKGLFTNECTILSQTIETTTGNKISNGGYFEIESTLTNHTGAEFEIKSGSEIVCDTLDNKGEISVRGDSCFCFTVFHLAEGSGIPAIDGNGGTCTTVCRYASGEADNAKLETETGEPIDSLKLTPGLHTIKVRLNEYCTIDEELFVDGGMDIQTNEWDSICPGGETYLTCEINPGSEYEVEATYEWSPTTGIVDYDPSKSYQLVRPEKTTTYNLTVTTKGGCVGTSQVTVYILDYHMEKDLDKEKICVGDSVQLSANPNLASFYEWGTGDEVYDDTTGSIYITGIEPGEYTYWVNVGSNEYICELSDTFKFKVTPTPVLEVLRSDTAGTKYCSEGNITFTARGADEYTWYLNGDEHSNDSVIDVHFTEPESYLYVRGVYKESQCETFSEDEVVYVIQKPDIETYLDRENCLIPYQQIESTGGNTFSWSPSEGLSDTTISNPVALVNDTVEYFVTIADSTTGCEYTDSVTVYPILWPQAMEDTNICYGDSVTLGVTGGEPGKYIWSPAYALDNAYLAEPTTTILATTEFIVEGQDEYGCKNTDTVNVYIDPSCRCFKETAGKTYQWIGAVNNNWKEWDNWSSDAVDRSAYPGLDPDDNIVIDTISLRVMPVLHKDITIKNICVINGKVDLSDYSMTALGDVTFINSEIESALDSRDTLALVLGDSTMQKSAYFYESVFNASVKAFNSSELMLNSTVFKKAASFDYSGEDEMNCPGGNVYNGKTSITNSGSGTLRLAFNSIGKPDVYNGNVEFASTGDGKLYPGATYTDTIRRDVVVNGQAIIFGVNGGITHFDGQVDQYIGSDDLAGEKPVFKKIEINKDPNIAFSKLVLDIPVMVGLDESDYIMFIKGYVQTDKEAALYINKNTKVSGCTDEGYVEGPVIKVGNADFTYPVGGEGYYMPVRISGAAAPDTTMQILGEYVPSEQPLGPPVEPITSVSTCEYWNLYELHGRHDLDLDVTITWSPISCDILTDVTEMQVLSWDSLQWKGLEHSAYSGTRVTGGTLTNKGDIAYYKAFTFGSEIDADYGPTVGLSLNNYGAVIKVESGAHVVVNGNILNDKGKLAEGRIENEGKVHFKRDWTNNSTKDTVALNLGRYEMYGSFQRLRGIEPTTFSNLVASGHGRKELYADIFISDTIYINDNNFSTKRNSLHIRNTDPNALQRTTGYFSSSRFGGFLRRDIERIPSLGLNNTYLFPVGNSRMYRPVEISPGSAYNTVHTFGVRFLPYNPSIDTLGTEKKSATVKDVNTKFYHIVESDYSTDESIEKEPVNVRFYFNRSKDGLYQSIGHWDDEPEVLPPPFIAKTDSNIWKKASRVKIYIDSTNMLTPHSLELRDWTDFSSPNFALVTGAYVINTSRFGNPYYFNDQGVVYSMEGTAFVNKQPLYNTGHADDVMGEPISPEFFDSTEVSNIMVIKGDAFSKPGKIEITTYSDGTIVKDKDGLYQINFIDEQGDKYTLAPSVYDVIDETILILKSSEDFAPNVCPNDVKVTFTGGSPLVVSKQNPQLNITNQSIVNRFIIKDMDGAVLLVLNNSEIPGWDRNVLSTVTYPEGIYQFVVEVIDMNNQPHEFTGQFIIME